MRSIIGIFGLVLFLSGCGGGGGSETAVPVTVTTQNVSSPAVAVVTPRDASCVVKPTLDADKYRSAIMDMRFEHPGDYTPDGKLVNGYDAVTRVIDKIDCVGFDAWLLTPKNNLRWYSDTKDPISFDYNENMYIEEFILNASKLSKISVLTYAHYKSLYSFIDPIVIKSKFINYIPGTDRYTLMRDDFKNRIESIEKRYYPTGYIVNK
jgi:hypothetical protein